MPTLRARDGSLNIFTCNKLDNEPLEVTRNTTTGLLRRLFTGLSKCSCVEAACQTDYAPVTKSGLCSKHRQDFCDSCEGGGILGCSMKLREEYKKDVKGESQQIPRTDSQNGSGTYLELARCKESDRASIFFASFVVFLGRLHCRRLQVACNKIPQLSVMRRPIPTEVLQDLFWW